MKVVIISGPTGSGKTALSNNIQKKLKNAFVLGTDNYYKTGMLSKLLSIFIRGYFDRKIRFNHKLFKKDLNFILDSGKVNHKYSYSFKNKNVKKIIEEKCNLEFLIVEGIFIKELLIDLKEEISYFIELKTDKETCLNRVTKRDMQERGKTKEIAKRNFETSWEIYYRKNKKIYLKENTSEINFSSMDNLDNLIKKLLD